MKADKLIELIESYYNGNHSHVTQQFKKLTLTDRARIIPLTRCYYGDKMAFEMAEIMITKDFN
jgi:hypothetical protein